MVNTMKKRVLSHYWGKLNKKEVYEKIIDDAADKIENFIQKANLNNQIQ